jgi:hypothetical protein
MQRGRCRGARDFADFGGPGRPYAAPAFNSDPGNENASDTGARRRWRIMERETGFEPATLSLGKGKKPKK